MLENNGKASLNYLYKQAGNFKELPVGDWKKTLRGVLYREVNKGRFKKIGLGVYALEYYENETSAYTFAAGEKPIEEYLKIIKDRHSAVEGMLLEIGTFFDYTTYTSDLNKNFDGKRLSDLCGVTEIPDFTYKELKSVISKYDTIWFTKSRLLFPKYIFEVEHTTDFTNSMLKMYQLLNYDTKFVLVASEKRKKLFIDRINKEPFVSEKERFVFRSIEDVVKLYFNSVEHYELKDKFLT